MIRRPPRSTLSSSSAASDVYKRQVMEMRTLLEDAGCDLKPIPEDYEVHLLPVHKPDIKGPDSESNEQVAQAVMKRQWGPKDKEEAKRYKFKMKRYKRYVDKQKGPSCAIM
eukprot:TRINITY_DN27083_c0_g2_i1.p1 TRINITY_DN27083_c0_g2~~TRINITY_DN27083_c0_g2_i1.p1  ORF type:complete len:111 (-),score=34.52 TRINITY_DN27083_c0_g2_i1:322-654(-)